MKKLLLSLVILFSLFFGLTLATNYSQEFQDAYNFAYINKITTQNSIDKADMNGGLTRIAMAKMLSQYAINILGKTPDTSKIPNFGDVDFKLDGDYNNGVTLSYQLGIMGVGIDKFRPFDSVTRAEFGTALSRVLYGDKYEGGAQYYTNHLNALKSAGIMNQITQPNQVEVRGFVMLMLMRSNGNVNGAVDCDNSLTMLECELDLGNCPTQCKIGNISSNEHINNYETSNNEYLTGNLEFSEYIFYKSSLIRTGDVTYFNQFSIKSNTPKIFSIKFKKIGNIELNHIKSIWLQNESGKKISKVINDLQNDEFELIILDEYNIPNDLTSEIRTLAVVIDNLGIGTHDLGFKVLKVENNAKYRKVSFRGDNRKLSLTVDKKLSANYQIELEIIDKENKECPDVFRKDEYYDMFNFIIHKKESDPLVSLGQINIAGESEGFKNRLQDIEIYINGKKINSNNYTWKILKYDDSAIGELHPLQISFKENIDIKSDSDVLIKGKYGGFNLEKYLSKYAGYTCSSTYWEDGFATRVTNYDNFVVLYDKKSGQVLSGKNNIINESGVDTLRSRTIETVDNTHEWFEYQTYFVYTCDTFSDFYTSQGYGNMTITVGYGNTFEKKFGMCSNYKGSSNNNSQNDNTSNTSNDENENSDSSNTSRSNNDNSSNNDSNNQINNDSDDEDNSSKSSNDSISSLDNCVNIEVDTGISYSFCITKWKSDGSKFNVSVDNANDLSLCTVGKGGQNYDFYDCEGDITSMGNSGISQLRLSIKYNNKIYSKKVDYDLTKGVFIDN